MPDKTFTILETDPHSAARTGLLATAHGTVETPVFCPVGTAGTVKGITPQQLLETRTEMILANIYHLLLRPGIDVIEKIGGLHTFMGWPKPIITDSGGYQILSLSPLVKIRSGGVEFSSHVDGQKILLTAETAVKIQNRLGADIVMCLDQCTPFPCPDAQMQKAVETTLRWAAACKKAHANPQRLLFGIVQGGVNPQLRRLCATELVKLDFDGYAIGGLCVGEGHENMIKTVGLVNEILPQERVRYLMGAGTPADIIAAVAAGVDIFDCVLPTRNGRNAFAFTEKGPLRLRNSLHIQSTQPVEDGCDCYCCRNFTRAAIRHFFNCGEMLGPILLSVHNISFYQRLMAQVRQNIQKKRFSQWAREKMSMYFNHEAG
ncbi:MAG TPA: tRNA guanosine(34) transglycosylase Tgt [Sedimentisphaerales bacterium]|nr:tRNA guanosine(34) transglycosylase Tgt [Sedimentisphaerales bacterium]